MGAHPARTSARFDRLSAHDRAGHIDRSAHVLGYGLLDASRRGGDEMPEHRGLYWIRRGRIFRVPLDAEVPARMILQRHRLDHTVARVRRWNQANSQPGDALVVVTGDGGPASDDLTQWGCLVDLEIMNTVSVVAHRVIHVLDKITTERDVDDLSASADRQQRQVIRECDARHGKVKRILLLIDAVFGRVRLLA